MIRIFRFAGVLLVALQGASFAQKISVPNPPVCTGIPSFVSGHDCKLAFDGNSGTEYQGSTNPFTTTIQLTLDLGAVKGIKRIKITWGTTRPSGFQINFKSKATDGYVDIAGGTPTGAIEDITLPWSRVLGGTPDTARYVQIAAFPGDGRMDVREIELYGKGVYTEDEILSATYPLGNIALTPNTSGSLLLSPIISNTTANRLVGLNAVVTRDDGVVTPLVRLLGIPMDTKNPDTHTPGNNTGGSISLVRSGTGWRISVNWGQYFLRSFNANYARTDVNRGYVTLYYLAHDPDYLGRE